MDLDTFALDLIETWEARKYLHPAQKKAALQVAIRDALKSLQSRLTAAERERDEARDLTSASITVGRGLVVYGTWEALHRVQNFILLDSTHPVEREDVRRSLARQLQAAEAALAARAPDAGKLREALRAERQTFKDAAAVNLRADMLAEALHDLLTRPTDPAARQRARKALGEDTP